MYILSNTHIIYIYQQKSIYFGSPFAYVLTYVCVLISMPLRIQRVAAPECRL